MRNPDDQGSGYEYEVGLNFSGIPDESKRYICFGGVTKEDADISLERWTDLFIGEDYQESIDYAPDALSATMQAADAATLEMAHPQEEGCINWYVAEIVVTESNVIESVDVVWSY